MIVIKVMERDMIVTTTSRITSGSVNLPVKFHFKGDEWEDLVKTAVFIGSGEERDVALITDECAVPADVLTEAGGDLKIGVYGRLANGATVIPTIWGRVQYIYEGTEMGEPSPHSPEPDWTAQVQQAAATALTKAQAVEEAAARGDFDGVSPEVTIDTITHGHSVTITDEEHPEGQSFPVLDGASAYEQAVAGGYTGTEAQFNQELQSFKTLSEQAAGSATQAAGSASAAAGSASAAAGSETAAAGSASAAAGAASAAAGSASAAEQSAIDAAAAAEATGGSETAAAASATAAAASATAAADSATAAEEHEYDAEAWADGERKGSPVGSADKTYHNNAKYYAQQAGASATAAGQSVDAAAESATAAAASATAAAGSASAAETAKTQAEAAKTATETARDTAVSTLQTEGAAQRTAIQQKGAEVLESIPSDYSDLSDDVDDLKSALSGLWKVTFEEKDGYIASYGTIESPTSDAEKNTNRISVKQGDVFGFSMSFNETRSMWAGYATYDESGAFIERVMIVTNVSGNIIHHIFTIGSGIGSIAFTYRSFETYSPTICKYSQIDNVYSDSSNSINAINISNLAKRVGDYPCELGSIYYGDNTDATNRCRTSDFISVSLGDAFKCDNPYLNYAITLYTDSGVFISDTGWKSGEFTVSNSSAHFARVNMRKADNSVIATTEISDIANDVKFIRSDIWGAIDKINVESTKMASIVQTASDYDCELGTIYLGQDDVSTARCRTSGFIKTFGCKVIVKGEYLCAVSLYDNDKNFILDSGWQKTEYIVSDSKVRYIRLVMRKKDSSEISNAEVPTIASTFTIIRKLDDSCFTKPYELPTYFETEAEDCASKLKAYCTEKALAFGIVTDTHIYEAPIGQKWWHDTVLNMARVNDIYPLDSIIHLGDIINGSLPSDRSGLLLEEARDDLNTILKPTFMLVGNHDPNLFYDNGSDPINEGEMYALIERYNEIDTTARPSGKPYWYKDYEPLGIRVIYLSAHLGDGYDKSEQSWGYPQEEVSWYSNIALNTDKQVLILSHMPFSQGYVSYVSTAPTNGDEMKSVTDAFISGGGIVIGLINGHTHFDYVHDNGNFKEISLGAETNTNNTSDKTGTGIYGYAPETAIQYGRTFGTLTQDLWNILVVRPASKTCKLIRFGAGADVEWSY